jgi:hypothetical protein
MGENDNVLLFTHKVIVTFTFTHVQQTQTQTKHSIDFQSDKQTTCKDKSTMSKDKLCPKTKTNHLQRQQCTITNNLQTQTMYIHIHIHIHNTPQMHVSLLHNPPQTQQYTALRWHGIKSKDKHI